MRAACFLLLGLAGGCGTSEALRQPDGSTEFKVSCWYFGWHICHDKARSLCPMGYRVLSEEDDQGRRMRIACGAPR